MCIIIDADALSVTFDSKNKEHEEFKPVHDWIVFGKGKIVYGGSQYAKQLRKVYWVLKLFTELEKLQKIVTVDTKQIDAAEQVVEGIIPDMEFDDRHIAAIVVISKCRLVCTREERAPKYLKQARIYPKGISKPLFYTSKRNKNLLCDSNIAEICKPCKKSTKATQELIVRHLR
jgi:hypothetical protein